MRDKERGEDMGQVIQIDEARIKDHLGEMVVGPAGLEPATRPL